MSRYHYDLILDNLVHQPGIGFPWFLSHSDSCLSFVSVWASQTDSYLRCSVLLVPWHVGAALGFPHHGCQSRREQNSFTPWLQLVHEGSNLNVSSLIDSNQSKEIRQRDLHFTKLDSIQCPDLKQERDTKYNFELALSANQGSWQSFNLFSLSCFLLFVFLFFFFKGTYCQSSITSKATFLAIISRTSNRLC